ncbi:MAG: CRISPR-associated helicase Cas3' [Rhodothermales bacterium]
MNTQTWIAHSENQEGKTQPLFEHLEDVARLAERFARSFQSGRFAAWLGWWHDAGKVAEDVQAYLNNPDATPPGPDHSSAGMLAALNAFEPLAANVAGHHGGLSDAGRLKNRITRKQAEQRVLNALAVVRPLLAQRVPSIHTDDLPAFVRQTHQQEFWLRMLHSALVDADCLDTERHFESGKAALRQRDDDLCALWTTLEARQRTLIEKSTGEVNAVRATVYQACLDNAGRQPGIYSLTVPTGGGKTRSAMAFALKHAVQHGLRRVIVALPYTSIIEQNADVYRGIFGAEAVLEHHSAVADRAAAGKETLEELRARLAAQNWDAPIIVTTTVQLFESLFSNRNSRLRKLHRIARSVLVLDEVQTFPPHLLAPTLDVLRHLVEAYGVTVLLCTATQPALTSRDDFAGFENVQEIVPYPEALFERLRRVRYEVDLETPWSWERVAQAVEAGEQAMVVLNTKRDAMALLNHLPEEDGLLHLSTQLCGAHRRKVLAEVDERLRRGWPVRLIATQVVEAGVDLDFPVVFRALGPLDSIIQAAGRCNREGRLSEGRVVVFQPEDGGVPPGAYRTGAQETRSLFREDPALDLHDPAVPLRYFRRLYDVRNLDERGIQKLRARLMFEQTARAYRLIEDDRTPVVVRYGEADALLTRIERKGFAVRTDFRALQPYLVNLRTQHHERAQAEGLCEEVVPGIWRWVGGYDEIRGLTWDIPTLDECVF